MMNDVTQYGEGAIIDAFFGARVGSFLDIGAHAFAANSNTRGLAERGWSGVCVEPSPRVFPELLKEAGAFKGVRCINAAIAAESKVIRFWDANGDQLATSSDEHREKWAASGHPFQEMYLCSLTFPQLLDAFPGPFRFLSVDTEGTNLQVLRSAPLERMGVELVCVEKDPGVREELTRRGMKIIHETAGNLLASR